MDNAGQEPPKEPWQKSPAQFPAPLDLTCTPEGHPFLVRQGPGFEWKDGKLCVLFVIAGGPCLWRDLTADKSRRLLEWMLKSAEVGGG